MIRSFLFIFLLMLAARIVFSEEQLFVPPNGFVPNEETAVKIAEAVWVPIYSETVLDEKPFKAQLIDGVWHVEGTAPQALGGVAEIEINKMNGKILRVSHGE